MARSPSLRLITWPYHNGLREVGMGSGSSSLAGDVELKTQLESIGWSVTIEDIPPVDERHPEITRVMELVRRLRESVRRTTSGGAFPLVLAGNCNSSLGTVAGVDSANIGVVWFDAHADFDTPDDNASGFFDVMGLAMLTGSGWAGLRSTIPHFSPVPEHNVVLAAVRDLAPYQRERLDGSRLRVARGDLLDGTLAANLDDLATRVNDVYLHIDLDCLDSREGRANEYAAPGGPSLGRIVRAIDEVFDRFRVRAAALTAYDPAFDHDGRVLNAGRSVLRTVGQRASEQHSGS